MFLVLCVCVVQVPIVKSNNGNLYFTDEGIAIVNLECGNLGQLVVISVFH